MAKIDFANCSIRDCIFLSSLIISVSLIILLWFSKNAYCVGRKFVKIEKSNCSKSDFFCSFFLLLFLTSNSVIASIMQLIWLFRLVWLFRKVHFEIRVRNNTLNFIQNCIKSLVHCIFCTMPLHHQRKFVLYVDVYMFLQQILADQIWHSLILVLLYFEYQIVGTLDIFSNLLF